MNNIIKVTDSNLLKFLQTKNFRGALCNQDGTPNPEGNYIDPNSETALSKTFISVRRPQSQTSSTIIKNIDGIEAFTNCESLSAAAIGLTEINNLPPKLKILGIMGNYLEDVDFITTTIENLDISSNSGFTKISFPSGLKKINCNCSDLEEITSLPEGLEDLDCSNNELKRLPSLPKSLKELDCSENKITEIPPLPEGLENLYASYNKLAQRIKHPSAYMDLEGNRFKKLVRKDNSLLGSGEDDNYELKLAITNTLSLKDKKLDETISLITDEADVDTEILMYGFVCDVKEFIEELTISRKELQTIETLHISRANNVIFYLDPSMDEEVDDYDIASFDGIEELENLKVLEIESGVDEDIDWDPILNHPKLEKVVFSDEDDIPEELESSSLEIEVNMELLNEDNILESYFNPED